MGNVHFLDLEDWRRNATRDGEAQVSLVLIGNTFLHQTEQAKEEMAIISEVTRSIRPEGCS